MPWTTWFWPGHSTFFSSANDSPMKRQGFRSTVAAARAPAASPAMRGRAAEIGLAGHQRGLPVRRVLRRTSGSTS